MPAIDPNSNRSASVKPGRARKRRTPTVQPNPDQRTTRSPGQQRRDQAAVNRSVGQARAAIRQRQIPTGDRPSTRGADLARAQAYVRGLYADEDKRGLVRAAGNQTVRYRPGTTVPPDVAQGVLGARVEAARKEQQAARLAPALTILNQLSRPVHGVAAGTRAAIHGDNPLPAAGRGLALKDKSLFSDVLGDLGVHGAAKSIGGFALDVGLDPTTYVSFGEGSIARKGLEKAADKTGATKVTEHARGSLPGRLVRHVNPNIRPAGVSKEDFNTVREAMRRSRATASTGEHHARNVAQSIARKLPGDSHPQITDALEARSTKGLNRNDTAVAKVLTNEYDRIHSAEHSAGLVGAKFPEFGYSPRRPRSELEPQGSRRRLSGAQLASSKARTNRRPYAEFRGSEHDIYTENAPLAYYLRARDSAVKQGRNHVVQALHSVGRVWHPGAALKDGEEIFKFAPRKMPTQVEGDELKSLMAGGAPAGRNEYRILHRDLVNTATQGAPERIGGLEELGRIWDRQVQGRVKTILTVPNPQYHLTNLYGDLFNAYLGSSTPKLARNLGISVRALKYKARREAAARTLGKQVDPKGAGVKIGGQRLGMDELIKEAEEHGAIGQGFIGRDLAEVLDAQGKEAAEKIGQGKVAKRFGGVGRRVATSRVGSKITHPIDAIRDLSQYREDGVRLATYLGARKRGLDPDKAASYVARHHFDYGDLTQFERSVLRRVLPFYTFTARNTPLQIRTLLERPGKYANLEKAREEAQKTSDVPQGYEKNLRLFEQQGIPIPIPGTGNLLYPKLPATDLSRLTVKDQGNYLLQMLTPLFKAPLELSQNYSFFFRQPIDELLNSPGPHGETARTLKPAPGWLINAVRKIPAGQGDAILKDLHIRQYTDQSSGKRVWGWPAKLDYILKQSPASSVGLQLGTGLPTSRGQTTGQKIFGFGTGLKVAPYSTPQIDAQRAHTAYNYLQAKAQEMRHNGDAYTASGARTPAYERVLNQTRAVTKQLDALDPRKKPNAGGLSPAAAAALSSLPQGGSQFSPAAQAALDALGGR